MMMPPHHKAHRHLHGGLGRRDLRMVASFLCGPSPMHFPISRDLDTVRAIISLSHDVACLPGSAEWLQWTCISHEVRLADWTFTVSPLSL
jgi:hypothetical protein